MPLPEKRFIDSRMSARSRRLNLRPVASITPAPISATPSPPICIKSPTKNCPSGVNVSATSTVTSPVTHTALAAVYSASI